MKNKNVIVLPYNSEWETDFEKIKQELVNAIGNLAVCIEHVGSTSVKGLFAKPIIDIDIVISDYSVFYDIVNKLETIGYFHEGDLGIKDREVFKYSDKPHLQKHHLYVCPQNSEELFRHITFRNFLRNNPEAVEKYSRVKEKAAELFPNNIEEYMKYKAPCIEEMYKLCGLS